MPVQAWPKPQFHPISGLSDAETSYSTAGGHDRLDANGFLLGRVIRLEVELRNSKRPDGAKEWAVKCKNRDQLLRSAEGWPPMAQTEANAAKNADSARFLDRLGLRGVQVFFTEDMVTVEGYAVWIRYGAVPGLPPSLKTFLGRFRRVLFPIEEFIAIAECIVREPGPEPGAPENTIAEQQQQQQQPEPRPQWMCRSAAGLITDYFRSLPCACGEDDSDAGEEETATPLLRVNRCPTPALVDLIELLFPPRQFLQRGQAVEEHTDREIVVCLNSAEKATNFSTDVFLLSAHAPDVMVKGHKSPSYEPEIESIRNLYLQSLELCDSVPLAESSQPNTGLRRVTCVFRRKPAVCLVECFE